MPEPEPRAATAEDMALLAEAIAEAGALAATLFRQRLKGWLKPDGSQVSQADLAVDKLLRALLCGARPGYGWLSEETPDDADRLGRSHLWIADPIDGTSAFLSGSDEWCIGVALAIDGQVAASAVLRPLTDALYSATLGQGARLNNAPLVCAPVEGLAGARIIGNRSALARFLPAGIIPVTRTPLPLLLRFCAVAEGECAAALATASKNDWDLAAGHLILAEAGGVVSDAGGGALRYNRSQAWQKGFVASAPGLHAALIRGLA